MSAFESIRMKALKLAALAARGVGGEAAAAQAKLEALLARPGMTLLDLVSEDSRQTRELDIIADPLRPKLDKELRGLAGNCLAYVLQRSVSTVQCGSVIRRRSIMSRRGNIRWVRYYVMQAELTAGELEDWEACFAHYKPSFLSTRKKLQAALKAVLTGFLHQHDLFAPSAGDGPAAPLSPQERAALLAAMRAAEGDRWTRGEKLEQPHFMLA